MYWWGNEMKDLVATGKIVGFLELTHDYFYDFYSFSNKISGFSIKVQQPPSILVPYNGWSGASQNFIKNILKPLPKTTEKVKVFRIINEPLQVVRKFGEGYCLDTSLMLVDQGGYNSLTKGL